MKEPPQGRPTTPLVANARSRRRMIASSSEDEKGPEPAAAAAGTQASINGAAAVAAAAPFSAGAVDSVEKRLANRSVADGHQKKRMRGQGRVKESSSSSDASAEPRSSTQHAVEEPVRQQRRVRIVCSGQCPDAESKHQRREIEVTSHKLGAGGGSRGLQLADSDAENSGDSTVVSSIVQRSQLQIRSGKLTGDVAGRRGGVSAGGDLAGMDLLADSGAETSGDDDAGWIAQQESTARRNSRGCRTITDLGTDHDPEIPSWEQDLNTRSRAGCATGDDKALRAAFSREACTAAELRHLPPKCFLHGQPVFDGHGLVNLHLLAGAFLQLASSLSTADVEARQVGWLARRACSLGLVTARELARGRVSTRCHNQRRERAASLREQRIVLAEEKELCFPAHVSQKKADIGNDGSLFREPEDDVQRFMRHKQAVMELRSLNSSRRARMASQESHRLDLHEIRDKVMAPSLSFDWEERREEESEGDEGPSGLEVDAPVNRSNRDHRRSLFRDQIHMSVSRLRAMELVSSSGGAPLQSNLEAPQQGEQHDVALCGSEAAAGGETAICKEEGEEDEAEEEAVTATKLRRYRRMLPEDTEESCTNTAVLGHDEATVVTPPSPHQATGPPKKKRQTLLLDLFRQAERGACAGELSVASGADRAIKEHPDPSKKRAASADAENVNPMGDEDVEVDAENGNDLEKQDEADTEANACYTRLTRIRPLAVGTDCLHADMASSSTQAPGSSMEADSDCRSESADPSGDPADSNRDEEGSQCSWMAGDEQNLEDRDECRSERQRLRLLKRRRLEALRRERRLRLEVEDAQEMNDDKKRALHLGIATMRNEERQRLKDIISHQATPAAAPGVVRSSLLGQRGGEEEEAAGLFCPVGTRTGKILCFAQRLPGTSAVHS